MRDLADTSETEAGAVSAVLHRGLLARLRTVRLYEIAAWVPIAALMFGARHGVASEDYGLWLAGAVGAVVRLAIASEFVRCDNAGVSWRSLFVTHQVGWDEITSIEVAARPMKIPFRGFRGAVSTCLVIERGTGTPPLYVIPSLLVPLVRLGEFISAARLMCPSDWSLSDQPGGGRGARGNRRPSGSRVGRPTRPRER